MTDARLADYLDHIRVLLNFPGVRTCVPPRFKKSTERLTENAVRSRVIDLARFHLEYVEALTKLNDDVRSTARRENISC